MQTVLSLVPPHTAGQAAAAGPAPGSAAPQSAVRVSIRRCTETVVTEPAASVICTGAVAVALRSLPAAPGLFRAVQAARRQLGAVPSGPPFGAKASTGDRKSTRLNSSHLVIS